MILDVGSILAVTIPLILIVGAVGVAWIALSGRQRLRELAVQERIALIEKAVVPSPESNPAGFEAALAPHRVGLALTILLFFVMPSQARGIALGVGGALTVLGLTVLGNGLLLASDGVEGSRRNIEGRG